MKIATPQYVLRNNGHPFGPAVTLASAELICESVFGFSDKPFYDDFSSECELPLMPYPLVKGYLNKQTPAATGKGEANKKRLTAKLLKLVIVDAAGPAAEVLYAVTMDVVVEAMENRAKQILATHLLRFDSKLSSYRLEELSA